MNKKIKTRNQTKTTLIAAAVSLLSLTSSAMATITITDDFNAAHDYSGGSVTGTVWDGIVNSGGVVALNSNTTTTGQLRMEATGSKGWDAVTNNAPFLYMNVTGDFDARVQIANMTIGTHNVGALMARLGDPSANGTAGEDYMTATRNRFNATPTYQTRYATDGPQTDSGQPASTVFPSYLRLTRTGNTFNAFRSDDGSAWIAMNWGAGAGTADLVRTDLNGLPLQVGLWQGAFSSAGKTADFENFSIVTVPEPSAAALIGLGGLALIFRRRK